MPASRKYYVDIINQLTARGAECVIFGCTEIMLLIDEEDSAVPIFDTTTLHVDAAVEMSLSEEALETKPSMTKVFQ